MAESRYYWIKLRTDFFADDSPMDILLSQPNGSEYVCLYIKLCLATANKQGRLCNQFGEMLIPYDIEKIQRDMKHFSIDTVRVALELYKKMGLVYEEADGMLCISNHDDMVGSETKWASYKRNERSGQSLDNVQQILEIRDKDIRDKENKSSEVKRESKKFTPPTLEEVEAFIQERGYAVNAEYWFNYYKSNGWMVGRTKMKDWEACIAQWNARDKDKRPKETQSVVSKWENA